jgi:phenylacetate-CoA ligase
MSSEQRLAMIDGVGPTVICCTPTYALHLAEVASRQSPGALARSAVRIVIVAGEPGGSIAATRKRIEQAWGARVIDHHGLTEVGPVSFECQEAPGFLHVNEAEYVCEVLEPGGAAPVPDGTRGELVLTNLGRIGSPVIRYRTGDLVVRRQEPCACGRTFARLEGGVLARADDMVNVRGVNVYPAAIEAIVRDFPEVVEFRAVVSHRDTLPALTVEVELAGDAADAGSVMKAIGGRVRQAFGLNVPVVAVAPATLPRFETKSRRFVIEP